MQCMCAGRHCLAHPPSHDIVNSGAPHSHTLCLTQQLRMQVRAAREALHEMGDRRVANMGPAAQIVGTDRNTML